MITLTVLAFLGAFLFNLYVLVFGKKDLDALKQKISIRQYLREIEDGLLQSIGDKWTTLLKILFIILSIVFVIFNVFSFLLCIAAIMGGTFAAKKSWEIPSVSNLLNKIATYINRLR